MLDELKFELYIIQNNTVKGRVNNLQAAISIFAQLVAADPTKDVVIKENNHTDVVSYKAGDAE